MKPWIVAHRGASDEAPENTKSAFDRALDYPIDGLEFDVQMTADGELVLYHDATLYRIAGVRRKISDFPLEELRQLSWGRGFSEFAGETLLTFRNALDLYAPRTRVMVEIKSRKNDRRSGRSSAMTRKVLRELEKPEIQRYADNIFILSFDPGVLKLGIINAPQYKYVLNLSEKPGGPTGYRTILDSPESETEPLFALCAACKNFSDRLVQFSRRRNLRVMTYVCNSVRQVRRAIRFGVDVIMTDKPGWLAPDFSHIAGTK